MKSWISRTGGCAWVAALVLGVACLTFPLAAEEEGVTAGLAEDVEVPVEEAPVDETPVNEPLVGMTAHIVQEINLGDLSCAADYDAWFCPRGNQFRVEGKMVIKTMGIEMPLTMVGNGSKLKQLTGTFMGTQASTVDLEQIWAAIPDYKPSEMYDPVAYKEMVESVPDKKSLGTAKMDGVRVEGYEVLLAKGRASMPSNVPLRLPSAELARVWLNPKDGIPRKVELANAQGNVFMRTHYQKVRTGVKMAPERFELEFPAGMKPIDMTKFILSAVMATPPKATEKKDDAPKDATPTDKAVKEGAGKD